MGGFLSKRLSPISNAPSFVLGKISSGGKRAANVDFLQTPFNIMSSKEDDPLLGDRVAFVML